jgi:hypothetical protein
VKIRYLKHNEIDIAKWDECISHSLNGIVYAYSWYLDIVAGDWDALVGDNYDAVFPLVKGRKFGISYIYQPLFTQQLGVFSSTIIELKTLEMFIESIPKDFQYQEINFNLFNRVIYPKGKISERVTFQLDLVQPYFSLCSNFNENTKRNISRSIALGVNIQRVLSITEFIEFTKRNLLVSLKDSQFKNLEEIIHYALENKVGEIYSAYTKQNELCAVAFFVRSNDKVIYLSAASNELGKGNRAMFTLVDRFINDNSESHLVLDFEGSNFENIARFYAGFGAIPCKYQRLVINNLPWYLKPFKR